MKQRRKVKHNLPPIYDEYSEILILGSLPSVESRKQEFYYAHPKNRFWQVLSNVLKEQLPNSIEEKKTLLRKNKIALYDVINSCTITGSSDSSIKDVKVNNISKIIKETHIKKIYTIGKTAYNLYNKYLKETTKIEASYLPSTSPANAKMSLSKLIEAYQIIREE